MNKIVGLNGQPLVDEKARVALSVASPDTADKTLLGKIIESGGLFMIPIGMLQPPPMQQSFIRAIINDWIRLVDVVYGPMPPRVEPMLQRVYKIEPAGRRRFDDIKAGG